MFESYCHITWHSIIAKPNSHINKLTMLSNDSFAYTLEPPLIFFTWLLGNPARPRVDGWGSLESFLQRLSFLSAWLSRPQSVHTATARWLPTPPCPFHPDHNHLHLNEAYEKGRSHSHAGQWGTNLMDVFRKSNFSSNVKPHPWKIDIFTANWAIQDC